MSMIEERYELARERVEEICGEKILKEEFQSYFSECEGYLAIMAEEYDWIARGGLENADLEELRRHNEICHIDLLGRNYDTHYANPAYAAAKLGDRYGQLLAAVSAELHCLPAYVYEQDLEQLVVRMELLLELYRVFLDAQEELQTLPSYDEVHNVYYWYMSDYADHFAEKKIADLVDWDLDFARRIIEESDLDDIRYLFYYGEYINDNQWKTAEYLSGLEQEKIDKIASAFTEGYRRGFKLANKPLDKKKSVNIRYPLGFERIIKKAIGNFREMGLEPVIYRNPGGFYGAAVNRQFAYDHENDAALYLDKRFVQRNLDCRKRAWEVYKEKAYLHAGPAVFISFGEDRFDPVNKPEKLQLSEEQAKLSVEYSAANTNLTNEYIIPTERSFTMIAFPIPEIGEDFEAIFDGITEVNTLDYELYSRIQQTIIDTLDKASYVRVKGAEGNRTDLTIKLQKLNDPARETNFENCLADVNIPVGEVFTSPQLAGTNGVLHVSKVFLGVQFDNLEVTFKDGRVSDFTCTNFETEEENRRLVLEKVMARQEDLPMGEFAIGTNTTAYVMAQKYDIQEKLTGLIAEKTGPHFAVGNTCYKFSEDVKVYNPDGKEIVAKDNEISILRKTDRDKAYFNTHCDITLPYDELCELTAVAEDGTEYVIIRDGRFVLDGTEELNIPFFL